MTELRWLLIDEFVEIKKGRSAAGLKNVTRAEAALTQTFPAVAVMPPSLMCEMMAQVGGVLAGATIDFTKEVVLAKITNATFFKRVTPPAQLRIEATLSDIGEAAARTACAITANGVPVAEGAIFFGLFERLGPGEGGSIVFSKSFMETFGIREVITA